MRDFTVGIVGIGRLGEALARAVLRRPHAGSLYVSKRSPERVAALVRHDPRVVPADIEAMAKACHCLIIALPPTVARDVLAGIRLQPWQHVISVMAETRLEELSRLTRGCGSVCRLLALPSIAAGGQILPLFPETESARRLFGADNELVAADSEDALLSLWAITGLLSAAMMVGEVAARWLVDAGIEPRQATAYSRTLFSEVHAATVDGFTQGIEHVSTPGGLNAMAYQRMKDAGVDARFRAALDEIALRLAGSGTPGIRSG